MSKTTPDKKFFARMLSWLLVVGGFFGLLASAIITIDEFKLLENPNFTPSCSINPIISCGSVMQSAQSHVFGFPNPIIGLAAFGALITIGLALLAGAQFKKWFWLGLELGTIFGVVFVHWLLFQSIYRIQALCIYCMIVWAVTIPIFLYVSIYNVKAGNIPVPKKMAGIANFKIRHHGEILAIWYIIIAVLILHHFWYYFGTVL